MPRKQYLCAGPPDWNRCPSHGAAHAGVTAQGKSFCSSQVTPLGSYIFARGTTVQCCWGIWGWDPAWFVPRALGESSAWHRAESLWNSTNTTHCNTLSFLCPRGLPSCVCMCKPLRCTEVQFSSVRMCHGPPLPVLKVSRKWEERHMNFEHQKILKAHFSPITEVFWLFFSLFQSCISFLLPSFSFKVWANRHFQTPISISRQMKEMIANFCRIYSFKNMPITLGAVLLTLTLTSNCQFQSINKH